MDARNVVAVTDLGIYPKAALSKPADFATLTSLATPKSGTKPPLFVEKLTTKQRFRVQRENFDLWFWEQYKVSESGCWEWLNSRTVSGYGRVGYAAGERRTHLTHRVALELATGRPIGSTPGDEFACHHCDNRICINPAHLYWGTLAQNQADASARARFPRGEGCRLTKITEVQAREVLERTGRGQKPRKISREMGISYQTARKIAYRLAWRWLTI